MPASTFGTGRPSNALKNIDPRIIKGANPHTPDQLISTLYLECKCENHSTGSQQCQRCYLAWCVVERYLAQYLKWEIDVYCHLVPNKPLEVRVRSAWKYNDHTIRGLYETTFYIYTMSCTYPFYKIIEVYLMIL